MTGDPTPDPTGAVRDGDLGVSSERVGPTGPGQSGTDGVRDVSPADGDGDGEGERPEQSSGGPEQNPDPPVPPVAGYPSKNPGSHDHPYRTAP